MIKKYAVRFKVGFSVGSSREFRSEAHRIRFFTRRLFAVRNALEAERYRFPVLSDAGLEWGYPRQDENVKTGLGLDPATVRLIYAAGAVSASDRG